MIEPEGSVLQLLGMHVREVLEVATHDEEVKSLFVDRPESTNEEVGVWFTNGEPHPRHSSGVLLECDVHAVFAEFRWWHRHQVHSAERALPRSTRPNIRMHRAPEGIWQVVFADDLDENAATGVE